ncbi:MAG: hypothetical protein ACFE9R_13490 [Candidatus Hermodarchaeota archaeon]
MDLSRRTIRLRLEKGRFKVLGDIKEKKLIEDEEYLLEIMPGGKLPPAGVTIPTLRNHTLFARLEQGIFRPLEDIKEKNLFNIEGKEYDFEIIVEGPLARLRARIHHRGEKSEVSAKRKRFNLSQGVKPVIEALKKRQIDDLILQPLLYDAMFSAGLLPNYYRPTIKKELEEVAPLIKELWKSPEFHKALKECQKLFGEWLESA